VYEDWRGNNYFFCGGRVILGSDAKFFVLTNVLILIPSILYIRAVIEALFYGIALSVRHVVYTNMYYLRDFGVWSFYLLTVIPLPVFVLLGCIVCPSGLCHT
jgi:hypothetical protein